MEPELDSISPNTVLPQYTKAVIINTYPHDVQAFTQGLLLHEGKLLESTGQYGQSSLRRVDITSGRVEQKTRLQAHLFGEGITLLNGKIYMITWQSERGFVFEPKNLMQIGEFYYKGEGWGLTDDGTHLILSNGTNILQFLDPNTFKVVRQVSVFDKSNPVMQLNELEYINGEIFANIWMSDMIVRINPETGEIVGWVDASELFPQRNSQADVLNGIAFNKETETFYLTGKNWSKLFEVRLEEKIQ
jgi:glutamine cyclotransferase